MYIYVHNGVDIECAKWWIAALVDSPPSLIEDAGSGHGLTKNMETTMRGAVTITTAWDRAKRLVKNLPRKKAAIIEELDLARTLLCFKDENVFNVRGYMSDLPARRAVVRFLRWHPELQLGADWIAAYLCISEEEVRNCLICEDHAATHRVRQICELMRVELA